MNITDIEKLIEKFDSSSLTELNFKNADEQIVLKREIKQVVAENVVTAPTAMIEAKSNESEKALPQEENSSYTKVKAPLVGTFYITSAPGAEPFCKIGDNVSKGQVLCIIEAMKMMNEIKAPCSGVLKKILVESEQMVEFDDVIMLIDEG